MEGTTLQRDALVADDDGRAVLAALVAGGPRTVGALARQSPFRDWERDRLELALGAAWVDGRVSIDADDAFVSLDTW